MPDDDTHLPLIPRNDDADLSHPSAQSSLPAETNRTDPSVIHAVEQNLIKAAPREAAMWTRIRGELIRQDQEDKVQQIRRDQEQKTHRLELVTNGIKLVMPLIFFVTGVAFLATGIATQYHIGLLLLGAGLGAYAPAFGSVIARWLSSWRN